MSSRNIGFFKEELTVISLVILDRVFYFENSMAISESNSGVPASLVIEFKRRSDIHWARKLWHMIGVSVIALIYTFLPESYSKLIITVSCFIFIPFDLLRTQWPQFNHSVWAIFHAVMRENEKDGIAGTTYLFLGTGIIIWIFPREVVLLSMLFLAFADPIASYFGIRFGKDKIFGQKSLQGSIAALAVCALLTGAYLYYNGLFLERLVLVSLICGLIGAIAELVPIWKLDDNLSLPVLSAIAINIVFHLFGAFT